MPKRLEVDHWRTTYWAARLKLRTGLSERNLEKRLVELRNPSEGFFERSGSFKKCALGKRTASLAIERGEGASAILLADRISPGSFWDFCLPLFDLLEEISLWREPELAHTRFVRRIRAEARVTHCARQNAKDDKGLVYAGPSTAMQERYSRLQRIRRAMLAIDGISIERFFRSGLPRAPGFYRTVKPMQQEELALSFPPTIRDFSLALSLFLESIEMADIDRYFWSLDLLLATSRGLEADECMKSLATDIWRLIDRGFPDPEALRNCERDSRASRTIAPLTTRELMSVPVFKVLLQESESLGIRTWPSRGIFHL